MHALPNMSSRSTAAAIAVLALALASAPAASAVTDTTQFSVTPGSLLFNANPNVPDFGVTLNGNAQTINGTMNAWDAEDGTGSGAGWNVTVQGDSSAGKSAVFKEYCIDGTATNGCSTAVSGGPGPGYVTTSPQALAANSLKLNSTSGTFNAVGGTTGTAPTHQCSAGCNVDSATAVKLGSAALNAGMGEYSTTYTATSLALSIPTTTKAIGTGNKVYRSDLIFTLATGP
jgi:hypothetical protein